MNYSHFILQNSIQYHTPGNIKDAMHESFSQVTLEDIDEDDEEDLCTLILSLMQVNYETYLRSFLKYQLKSLSFWDSLVFGLKKTLR